MSVIDEVQTTDPYTNVTTSAVTTTASPEERLPVYVGFIACVVTVSLYSVMFLPVKKHETGDGMFFQWCVCVGVGCVGVVVKLFRYQADFYPLSMIGGVCWVTGNLCVVPIVKTIGLGLGCTIWGILSLLSGWATGRFGLFHTDKDVISNNTLNNISVILFIFSAIILSLVRNNIGAQKYGERELSVTQEPLLLKERRTSTNESQYIVNKEESTMSPVLRQIVGVTLSIVSGILYGQVFTAAKYYQDKGYSPNGLDYVFSTYCGIFILGTVYLQLDHQGQLYRIIPWMCVYEEILKKIGFLSRK